MNYATIKWRDTANGPGVRISVFVSGCRHHCKNCFNQEAWDFQYGKPFGDSVIQRILQESENDFVTGLSFLGGEPFEPENQEGLYKLAWQYKEKFPEKSIWCYTGFSFEKELLTDHTGSPLMANLLLHNIDVLVDGRFIEELKDLSLIFRGSSNQNIIDVPKSLKAGKMVLLDGIWQQKWETK